MKEQEKLCICNNTRHVFDNWQKKFKFVSQFTVSPNQRNFLRINWEFASSRTQCACSTLLEQTMWLRLVFEGRLERSRPGWILGKLLSCEQAELGWIVWSSLGNGVASRRCFYSTLQYFLWGSYFILNCFTMVLCLEHRCNLVACLCLCLGLTILFRLV